jgi:hypothetical protein
MVHGGPSKSSAAETVVAEFYEGLSASQREVLCRPFADGIRGKINANWHITKPLIGSDFFSDRQRGQIERIVKGVTSEEGYTRLCKQMDEDDGGIGAFSVGVFGNPLQGEFQWVLTGRHLTLRADGDSVAKAAFGGGLVYGHGEESSPEANIYYFQTQQVNRVFKALDGPQIERALLQKAPSETNLTIQGPQGTFSGLPVSEMSSDQQSLVKDTLRMLLSPYRREDAEEAMALIEDGGGIGQLHFAFYREGDLSEDQVWDMWRVEGPTSVFHFRGAPHVHAYLNIARV